MSKDWRCHITSYVVISSTSLMSSSCSGRGLLIIIAALATSGWWCFCSVCRMEEKKKSAAPYSVWYSFNSFSKSTWQKPWLTWVTVVVGAMDDSFENPKRSHAVHTLISHKLLSKARHSTGSSSSIRYGSSKGSVVMNRHRQLHMVYPNIAYIFNITLTRTGNLKNPWHFEWSENVKKLIIIKSRVSDTHHLLCWACV